MPRKEIFCDVCGSDQPMVEGEPVKDKLNPYPAYDLKCGTCHLTIASIQTVPDDKLVEPANAVESTRPHLVKKVPRA